MRIARLAAVASLVLAVCSCSSPPWRETASADHAALLADERLVTQERGTGPEREVRVALRTPSGDVAPATLADLAAHSRPIDSAEAAVAFTDLARRTGLLAPASYGFLLTPDAALEGPGASGRYSRDDAAAWGVPFEPTARAFGGGFEVSRIVLVPPVPDPDLPKYVRPWRLVLVREVVHADGTVRPVDARTLTNGKDAARFAAF